MRFTVRFRTLFLAAISLGVVLRFVAVMRSAPGWDGSYYVAMGQSFASGREFLLPFGSMYQGGGFEPIHSQHFAPLWPLILAAGYSVGDFSPAVTSAMSLLLSLLSILVAFLATRDLYGEPKAWLVAAVVALNFVLIESAARAYSENLVDIFYTATIWAIVRALDDDRYVLWAGLFAGAGYLTKSSIGYFFLLAGAIGLLWRFRYLGWKVLRNRYYLAAIGIFATFVGAWAVRNIMLFGWPHWQTSPYTNAAVAWAFGNPAAFLPMLGAKVLLFACFLGLLAPFFAGVLLRELRAWRTERVSALLLSIGLPTILGVIFAASLALYEGASGPWWSDNVRYVDVAFVPLLWLVLRREPLPEEWWVTTRVRLVPFLRNLPARVRSAWYKVPLLGVSMFVFVFVGHLFGLVILIGVLVASRVPSLRPVAIASLIVVLAMASVDTATTAYRPAEYDAGSFLSGQITDGAVIAIDGDVNVYYLYPSLVDRQVHFVRWNGSGGTDYLISPRYANFTGYERIASFSFSKRSGLVEQAYAVVSGEVRSLLGVPREARTSEGDLFVYRAR